MLKIKIEENWLWLVMWVIFIVAAIYSRPLIPIDETRYLSVAWEMWHNNNFLVPHINGLPYSHKPPLLFWTIHLFWWVFGVGEWSGRMVAPLFGLAAILLTRRLAGLLWPSENGISRNVPYILFGMVIWLIYSSLTMFDTLLTCICLVALHAVFEASQTNRKLPWLWLSVAIGLGILAKGPVVLVYVLPVVLLVPWWNKGESVSLLRWYGFALGALVAGMGIALCWAIPAAKIGGEEYGQAILFGQTAGRVVNSFAHGRPFYWYLLLLPLFLFPWFFWLPVWQGVKSFRLDRASRFCLSILLPAFVLLSCISGKQIHYILPLLPVAALLIARLINNTVCHVRFDKMVVLLIYLVICAVFLIFPFLPMQDGDREVLKTIPIWIGIVPLLSGLFLLPFRPCSVSTSLRRMFVSVLLLATFFHFGMSRPLHAIYGQDVISMSMGQVQESGGDVAILPGELMDQFQFSGLLTKTLFTFDNWDKLAVWTMTNPDQYCLVFTRSKAYGHLIGSGLAKRYDDGWLIFRPAKGFLKSYQAWVANKTD